MVPNMIHLQGDDEQVPYMSEVNGHSGGWKGHSALGH